MHDQRNQYSQTGAERLERMKPSCDSTQTSYTNGGVVIRRAYTDLEKRWPKAAAIFSIRPSSVSESVCIILPTMCLLASDNTRRYVHWHVAVYFSLDA